MNVVALQTDIAWENKAANFQKVRQLLSQAKPPRHSLVLLPEMFATGFSMSMDTCAETYGGETEAFLAQLAQEFGVCIVGGAAMRGKDGCARNKALVIGPDGALLGYYAKMKLFSPGGEANHCVPGKRPMVFEWQGWKVCPFICYDLRFPEIFRQAAALEAPELFLVIANWPAKRVMHWLRLLPARAIENQAYVAGVNRVGTDPFYNYGGRTLVVDPHGEALADAGEGEGSVTVKIELGELRSYRQGLPFLNDLRPSKT